MYPGPGTVLRRRVKSRSLPVSVAAWSIRRPCSFVTIELIERPRAGGSLATVGQEPTRPALDRLIHGAAMMAHRILCRDRHAHQLAISSFPEPVKSARVDFLVHGEKIFPEISQDRAAVQTPKFVPIADDHDQIFKAGVLRTDPTQKSTGPWTNWTTISGQALPDTRSSDSLYCFTSQTKIRVGRSFRARADSDLIALVPREGRFRGLAPDVTAASLMLVLGGTFASCYLNNSFIISVLSSFPRLLCVIVRSL